ncbi:hypothetical protein ABHI18_001224 [Aspergillus niger]|jgi:hypothetical protein
MNDEEYETTDRLFTKQMKQLNLKISQEEEEDVRQRRLVFGGTIVYLSTYN